MTILLDPDESIVVCFTTLLPPGLYQVTWSLTNYLGDGSSPYHGGKENYIYLYKQVRWGEMLLCAINATMKIFFMMMMVVAKLLSVTNKQREKLHLLLAASQLGSRVVFCSEQI